MHDSRDDIAIRPATATDADGILACLAAAFEPYRESYTPEAYLDTVLTAQTIQQRLDSMQVFVAVMGSRIVGTIACSLSGPAEGHLRGMAVVPGSMGQGLAERLLRAAEDALAGQGCRRVTLDTTEPLRRAMRFYERNGYRRSGKTIDFFGMPLHEYVKHL